MIELQTNSPNPSDMADGTYLLLSVDLYKAISDKLYNVLKNLLYDVKDFL